MRVELVLGLGGLVVGLGSMAAIPAFGLSTLLATGLVLQGATYLTAPVLALLADRDLRARRRVMAMVRD